MASLQMGFGDLGFGQEVQGSLCFRLCGYSVHLVLCIPQGVAIYKTSQVHATSQAPVAELLDLVHDLKAAVECCLLPGNMM